MDCCVPRQTLVTFHAAAVIACVALRSFAAEQKECSVEASVLARYWCIHLQEGEHNSEEE